MAKQKDITELVLNRVDHILEKPRVSAHSPEALVEICFNLLSLAFDENKFQKYMFKEWGGARAWWLADDFDYPTAVNRLKKLVGLMKDGNFAL